MGYILETDSGVFLESRRVSFKIIAVDSDGVTVAPRGQVSIEIDHERLDPLIRDLLNLKSYIESKA